jgi:UDP-N-acetyl-D-galactosamine dehydrogenase
MGGHVAGQVVKLMLKKAINVVGSRILVLGFTFKEGCPDVRNTKVIDIVRELEGYTRRSTSTTRGSTRPKPSTNTASRPWRSRRWPTPTMPSCWPWRIPEFLQLGAAGIHALGKAEHVLYDVKSLLSKEESDGRL